MAFGVEVAGNLSGTIVAAGGASYDALILGIAFQESAAEGGITLVLTGAGNGNAGVAVAFVVGHRGRSAGAWGRRWG